MYNENDLIKKLIDIKGEGFDFAVCQDVVQNLSIPEFPIKQKTKDVLLAGKLNYINGNDKYVSFIRKKEHKHINKSTEILQIVSSGIEKLITCITESDPTNPVRLRNELYSNQITECISLITRMLENIQAGETGLGKIFYCIDDCYYIVKFFFKEIQNNKDRIYIPVIEQSLFTINCENQQVIYIYRT